jgi:hypothetical protein
MKVVLNRGQLQPSQFMIGRQPIQTLIVPLVYVFISQLRAQPPPSAASQSLLGPRAAVRRQQTRCPRDVHLALDKNPLGVIL